MIFVLLIIKCLQISLTSNALCLIVTMVTIVENYAETIAIFHDINVHVLFPLPGDRAVCTVFLDIITVITSPGVCDHVDTYVYMYGTVCVVKRLDNLHRVYSGLISV